MARELAFRLDRERLLRDSDRFNRFIDDLLDAPLGIERMLSLDIVGTPDDPLGSTLADEKKQEIREYLEAD